MESTAVESSKPAIDWAAITTPVECPLCLYNLWGLIEPRCPECGFAFDWPELFDPQRQRHPYLFEHHPWRNFWSFRRTLTGGLRTRKFWTTLKPTHKVHPRRLLIYWLLCAFLVLLAPAARAIQLGVNLTENNAWSRLFPVPGTTTGRFPSPQAKQRFLDTNFPLPPSRGFFQQYAQVLESYSVGMAIEVASIIFWPWLTFAALMIFQVSMRKAKLHRAHVLRCAIYAGDASVWYAFAMLVAVIWLSTWAVTKRSPQPTEPVTFWLLVLLWLLRLDRLTTAYRKYLRFDHPFFTVLASQIIVILAMGGLLFWGARLAQWICGN